MHLAGMREDGDPIPEPTTVAVMLWWHQSHKSPTIALTSRDGGKLGPLAQLNIQVPVPYMGRIEDRRRPHDRVLLYE